MKERILYRRIGADFEVWVEKSWWVYDVIVCERGRTSVTTMKRLEDAKAMVEQMCAIARRGNHGR